MSGLENKQHTLTAYTRVSCGPAWFDSGKWQREKRKRKKKEKK